MAAGGLSLSIHLIPPTCLPLPLQTGLQLFSGARCQSSFLLADRIKELLELQAGSQHVFWQIDGCDRNKWRLFIRGGRRNTTKLKPQKQKQREKPLKGGDLTRRMRSPQLKDGLTNHTALGNPSQLEGDQAIGRVISAQANFLKVLVTKCRGDEAETAASKSADFEAVELEGSQGCGSETQSLSLSTEPRQSQVGSELLCVVRSLLKKLKRRVLVGDDVIVSAIDWTSGRGMVEDILPRRSEIVDPPIANVDHLVLLFSLVRPTLEPLNLSRFLVAAEDTGVPFTLVLNKTDLVQPEALVEWRTRLQSWGYEPVFCSIETGAGVEVLEALMSGRVSVVAGPSGVGKSSLINALRRFGKGSFPREGQRVVVSESASWSRGDVAAVQAQAQDNQRPQEANMAGRTMERGHDQGSAGRAEGRLAQFQREEATGTSTSSEGKVEAWEEGKREWPLQAEIGPKQEGQVFSITGRAAAEGLSDECSPARLQPRRAATGGSADTWGAQAHSGAMGALDREMAEAGAGEAEPRTAGEQEEGHMQEAQREFQRPQTDRSPEGEAHTKEGSRGAENMGTRASSNAVSQELLEPVWQAPGAKGEYKELRVGEVSDRSGRGRHTTRHVELLRLPTGGLLADSPGFSQPSLAAVAALELPSLFPEIRRSLASSSPGGGCAFADCLHVGEPGCVVGAQWERAPHYAALLEEVRQREALEKRALGTKRESDVRFKTGSQGVRVAEPRLVFRKHRRESRKFLNQRLESEMLEVQSEEEEDPLEV